MREQRKKMGAGSWKIEMLWFQKLLRCWVSRVIRKKTSKTRKLSSVNIAKLCSSEIIITFYKDSDSYTTTDPHPRAWLLKVNISWLPIWTSVQALGVALRSALPNLKQWRRATVWAKHSCWHRRRNEAGSPLKNKKLNGFHASSPFSSCDGLPKTTKRHSFQS